MPIAMNKISLLIFTTLLSACASRTSVSNTNENIQSAMTLGTNKIAEAYLNDPNDKNKTVVVSITGEVIMSPTCTVNGTHVIELKHSLKDAKPAAWTTVQKNSPMTYKIDQKIQPGEYIIYLLRSKDSKVLQQKQISINKSNDRHVLNFDGCP